MRPKAFKSTLRIMFSGLIAFTLGIYLGYNWRPKNGNFISSQKIAVQSEALNSRTAESNSTTVNINSRSIPVSPAIGNETCVPQTNIMFLKTHKTASSAVQNVLLRYADKHNLVVGLSNIADIRFHYGKKFQSEYLAPSSRPINVLCHHMVFNYAEVQKVMPANTTYITILREPGALFESLFDYMHFDSRPFSRIRKGPHSMEFWLNHTDILFHGRNDGAFWWFAKNGVFFDMGYNNLQDDEDYIRQSIVELSEQFDLVLLADYFDESMVLLMDHLCWELSDILALKTNARKSAKTTITDRLRNKIRAWNKADAMVYDHFNRTFWIKVEQYGHERMRINLQAMREMNGLIQERCIDAGAVGNKLIKDQVNKVYNPPGVVMSGYNLKESSKKDKTCINLIKGEIQWTRELMASNKQKGKID